MWKHTSSPFAVLAIALLGAGCGPGSGTDRDAAPAAQSPASPLSGAIEPASYRGVLPCADCEGIRYTLNLFPDRTYFLHAVYLGRGDDTGVHEIGRWTHENERLMLKSGQDSLMFAVKTDEILRKLDETGREITSLHNHDLVRSASYEPIEPAGTFSGMYRHGEATGVYEECRTGLIMPVGDEGDAPALRAAYHAAQAGPGAAVLAEVEGRIVMTPAAEGVTPRATLVVDRFVRLRPGEICGLQIADAGLRSTRWVLTHLDGSAVAAEPERRPWLKLALDEPRMSGFTGCNQMGGTYTLDGPDLRFSDVVMTRMACPDAPSFEPAYPRALEAASSWAIEGAHLELYDDLGSTLLRFEAGPDELPADPAPR